MNASVVNNHDLHFTICDGMISVHVLRHVIRVVIEYSDGCCQIQRKHAKHGFSGSGITNHVVNHEWYSRLFSQESDIFGSSYCVHES